MNRQVRLIVSGKVQGVFYRASAQKKALSLNIKGYAKNRADGSVEVIADGSPDHVETLIAWCRNGPPGAIVSQVTVQELTDPVCYHGFKTL